MKNPRNVLWALAGLALTSSVTVVEAQVTAPATEKFFVNVNVGGQLAERALTTFAEKRIYEETATLTASQPVNRGMTFDVGAGYRVWGDVYGAVLVSVFGDTETADIASSIPNPIFFNRPKTSTGTATGLKRREVAVSPHAVWPMTLTDKLDVALGFGVSIIKLSQDLVGNFSVAAPTQNVVTITTKETGTATGLYAAADFIYNLKPRYGVGGFVRYAGGRADLPSSPTHNVGGMQVGGGIRLRF